MVILSFWIHELGLGGRSKLVQNILYLVVCFFLMRPYINACITKNYFIWKCCYWVRNLYGIAHFYF